MEDGSFVIAMGLHGDTKMPVVDIDADYGKYVVGAVENGSIETVYAAPAYITPTQIVDVFAKGEDPAFRKLSERIIDNRLAATGKKVKFVSVSDDELAVRVAQSRGERAAKSMVAMYKSFRDYGCSCSSFFFELHPNFVNDHPFTDYFGADLTASNKILSTPARTFDEMISANAKAVADLFT